MPEEKDNKEKTKVKPKKPFLKFIIMGVIVISLGVGGFFAWNLLIKGDKKVTKTAEALTPPHKEEIAAIYPLKSFIVNLLEESGLNKRYLKVTIELEVGGEEHLRIVERRTPQLRDTIILLLSNQTFKDISTMEGKLGLKQALLARINQVVGGGIVRRIYFSEFVVQ